MAKKKKSNYTNNNSKGFLVQKLHEANPDIPIESIRYAIMNDVSTPDVMIPDGPGYTNSAIYRLISEKGVSSNRARVEEINKVPKIPYIEDKEIMLRSGIFNTGKISTNLLDSLYDASKRVGVPFETALGLAGRESTLGIGRGFKRGKDISSTELMSNWQQVQDIVNTNYDIEKAKDILKRHYNNEVISQKDIDFLEHYYDNEQKELKSTRPITENPIDNALKYFMEGKYNPGDSRHTKMVEADGKTLINDPAIVKWMKENNKYGLGSWFKGATEDVKNWNEGITNKLMGSNFGQGLSNLGIKAGGLGGIANTAATAIGGLAAGGRSSGVGNAMQKIGSLASNIPGVGGLIGAGVNLLGGVVNGAFGSKLNAENIAAVEGDIKQALNFTSNAGDYDALASNYAGLQGVMGFDKDFIGKDGWAGGSKAKRKFNSLKTQAEEAEAHQLLALSNNAQNIADTNLQLLEANYNAYGGPIDMKYTGVMSPFGNQFKDGGIYIKPSKRGTFTAAAKKRGMGVQEFASKVLANKEDYSPAMVKKANFARNASKWKHDDGGPLDTRMELLRRLEEKRNRRGIYGGGKHGGAGAGSLFLKSPDDFTLVKDTVWVPYRETFNDAFGRARAAGLDEFMFDNKAYTTELGDNPDNNRAGEERAIEGLLPVERTRQVKNKKAEGGELFTNGVTTIGNGGTHEQNPYEGVQMGVDPQGVPNLVEEGEVIYNDYVFSNRLRVPKEIRQKYKLRGVTFADAAKQLQKESEERPNDPISKNGLNAAMAMLQQEQEAVRMKKESNKYAKGGKLGKLYAGTGPYDNYLDSGDYDDNIVGYTKRGVLIDNGDIVPFNAPEVVNSRTTTGNTTSSNGSTTKASNSNWLRYAPIAGHAIGAFSDLFSSPDYSAADTIEAVDITPATVGYTPVGNYLSYKPFDRDYYLNKLNADATASRRAITNTSGGNRAAAMAGLLAADYNYGNQLGALSRQAEEYNQALRERVEGFNRQTNLANAEMGLKAAMANAESRNQATKLRLSQAGQVAAMRKAAKDAYDARRSNNINVLLEELGELGTENWNRDWLDRLAKAGVLKIDSKGNPVISNAKGGKIRTKKKKGFTYG